MKHVGRFSGLLIMAISLFIGFVSCSSDDDEPTVDYSKEIIGTWNVTTPSRNFDPTDSFVFNADGTMTWIDGYKNYEQTNNTYHLNGNELGMELNVKNGIVDAAVIGTMSLSGKTMTYKYRWNNNTSKGWMGWTDECVVTLTKN